MAETEKPKLSHRERQIMGWRYDERLSVEDAAQRLDVTPGRIRAVEHGCITALWRAFNEQEPAPGSEDG